MALSPPPIKDGDFPYAWQDWFRQVRNVLQITADSIPWANISKAGSSLSDLVTRNHDVLQNMSGGGTYHLSSTQYASVAALPTFGTMATQNANNVAITGGTLVLTNYTVATLPAGVAGQRAYVTDAAAPAFGVAVVGGGGVGIPVYKDGVNWKVG